jgi:RNA polymerase sigma-70 factor, ECF subfamily
LANPPGPALNPQSPVGISFPDDPEPHPRVNETVRRAQQGDQAAFHELYLAHVGRVYAICLRLARDQTEAEEHTQDVFVRVWERLASFREESAFSTWLYRLAVNEVLQSRRAAGRRSARVMLAEDPATLDSTGRAAPAPTSDLDRAIAGLPEGARAVFVLHDVEGYQHEEIARISGIAEGTSKAQLHRARRLLREALDR